MSDNFNSVEIVNDLKVNSPNSYFKNIEIDSNVLINSATFDGNLELETSLELNDTNSDNSVTINPPALSLNVSLVLPDYAGEICQSLRTDGDGNLFWDTISTGSRCAAMISRTTSISNFFGGANNVKNLTFETVDFVQGLDISATVNGFTINATGEYEISLIIPVNTMFITSSPEDFYDVPEWGVYINSTTFKQFAGGRISTWTTSQPTTVSGTATFRFTAGDVLQIRAIRQVLSGTDTNIFGTSFLGETFLRGPTAFIKRVN